MKICVFGDSTVYAGYMPNSWVNLLRLELEQNYNDEVELFNLGINGNTSNDILQRFEVEARARDPELIIFALGVNDSGYIYNTNEPLVDSVQFEDNLNKLIKKAQIYTNDIFFVGLVLGDDSILKPYPESSRGKSFDHKRVVQYDNLIVKIAGENGCKHIYLYNLLDKNDFVDGLHPNKKGHEKMFHAIKANIEGYLSNKN